MVLLPLLVAPFYWNSIPFLWKAPPVVNPASIIGLTSEFIKLAPNETPLLRLGNIKGAGGHTYHAYCWQRSKDVIVVLSYRPIEKDPAELVIDRERKLENSADLKRLVTDNCRANKNNVSRVGYVTSPLDDTVVFVAITIFSIFAMFVIPAASASMFIETLFWRRCLVTRSKETAVYDFQNRWGPKLKKMFNEGQYRQYGRSILMMSDEMIVLSGFGECWFIEKSAIIGMTTAVIPILRFKLMYLKLDLYDDRVVWAQMNSRLVAELQLLGVETLRRI